MHMSIESYDQALKYLNHTIDKYNDTMAKDIVILDTIIVEFMNNHMPETKLELINNTLLALHNIQKTPGFEREFGIEDFDDVLVEVVTSNDELPATELVDIVSLKFLEYYRACLETIGLVVTEDIDLVTIEAIVTAFYDLLSIDKILTKEILEILDGDVSKKERVFELLTRYTDLTVITLTEVVVKIDDTLIEDLEDYFKIFNLMDNRELPAKILSRIQYLMLLDKGFVESEYLAEVVEAGSLKIKYLYKALEEIKGKIDQAGYEIYSYLYLNGKADHILDSFLEEVKIENIEWIGANTQKLDLIKFSLQELDNKVKKGR